MLNHGIRIQENPTSVIASVTSGITPVYIGTAPINMCETHNVNEPILCYSYAEAVKNFGVSSDFEKFTLCEAIDAHFSKFGMAPIVLINVLDSKTHKKSVAEESIEKINGVYKIEKLGVLPQSIVATGHDNLIKQFDDDGYILLTLTTEEAPAQITVAYDILDPTLVTSADIVGGIEVGTGKKKGLELVSSVFPKYRLIPSLILAPKFSTDSVVAAVMETKASLINGCFKGFALVDIDTETAVTYSDAPGVKVANNLISTFMSVNYPKVALGETQYHLSTQIACIMQKLSFENDNIPYKSPSNKSLKADKACLKTGESVLLGADEANYLNSNGITTALNFIGGWKSWGNRTGCYPDVTDPKDSFIATRMMFNWVGNSLIQTYWQKIDDPANKVLVQTIIDSANIWLNGLTNKGVLLGARVEFREEDNPSTDLMDGKMVFRIYFTPPSPGEDILFMQELDISYFSTLFG